jgi:hypothetical protein
MGWTARPQFLAGSIIFLLSTISMPALRRTQRLSQWVMVVVQELVKAASSKVKNI